MMGDELRVEEIWIYPMKSLGGISVQKAEVGDRGLKFDRRWMLVDQHGLFLTLRDHSRLALLHVERFDEGMMVHAPNMEPLYVSQLPERPIPIKVKVWSSICLALRVGDHTREWFSRYLNKVCELVYMPDSLLRKISSDDSACGGIVSFADAFPYSLTTRSSLNDLNTRLESPIPMRRFRSNFILSGGKAFQEDTWKRIRIGEIGFDVVKACQRCVAINVNYKKGEKDMEPLRMLSKYRRKGKKVYFGQNLVSIDSGTISVGDAVKILDQRSSLFDRDE